jgi:ATP-binding cassette, subfamily C, bacterial CydC
VRRLSAFAAVPAGRVAPAILLGALAICFGIGLMTAAGYLISRAAEQPPILALALTIVVVRFLGLARPLARYLERISSHDVALRSLARIRTRFYRRIEPLAPAQLEGYRRGELLNRLVADVDALQGLYPRGIGPPLVAALSVGAAVVAAAIVLPLAAVILAAGLLVGGMVAPLIAWALAGSSARRQAAARGELTADLVEILRGAPELVAYGREDDAITRVRAADAELVRLGRRDALVAGAADALMILVAGATVAGVLAVALDAHAAGTLDRVLVATLALLALASFDAVIPLPGAARELSGVLSAGRRVLDTVEPEPLVRDPAEPRPRPSARAPVVLEGVTARYGVEEPVLRGFDLRLVPGRRVALVGPSGAGKTTVLNLLLRFLDPAEGRVMIGGHDLREYRQEDVRATFALAGQDAHLFDSTIRENLRLARPSAEEAELWAALQRARLGEWVASLPAGLDSRVGEEGTMLSGGQRQRLVLARALLAGSPVLLLDEPTAHLDPATAEALMEDVLDAASDRAVLLVTHRPEGLERMDEIVSLR